MKKYGLPLILALLLPTAHPLPPPPFSEGESL